MSVLKAYFDKSVNQSSPIQKDYKRVVNYDEDGNEIITWEEVDYAALQSSNGDINLWALNNLLAAGVNPNFPIRTGLNTRLEGIDVISQAASIADSILAESENNESKS